jgi:hypothetical protein
MIKTLNSIDLTTVLECYRNLESQIQWTDYGHKGKQAGLQYKQDEDVWASAVGKSKGQELTYTNLNPLFKDTVFEEIIKQHSITRARLLWVGPFACYSMHQDTTPRVHVPLISNPDCYFVFKSGRLVNMVPGFTYWVDTRNAHTFMNCSEEWRLHFVGVVEK